MDIVSLLIPVRDGARNGLKECQGVISLKAGLAGNEDRDLVNGSNKDGISWSFIIGF